MGLGSTTKKIQTLADTAEKMFHRLNEVREQVETTQTTVQDTGDRVQQLETEIVEQRAILEAIATDLDIDLDAVSADAHINDAETEAATDSETDDDTDTEPDDSGAEA
ncbi:DUF5798 family protein [Halohasta litorea]|uniref:DUF5798 family protein n=1 Tax=Halohasta litorea TaxID=869891 RepID=A0ABD6D8P8_9EURY|nr:DUF5798 family protein [Halohasta litorea]MEA1932062.1 DUF5798 family protein [Euryarchaeota archaeon]